MLPALLLAAVASLPGTTAGGPSVLAPRTCNGGTSSPEKTFTWTAEASGTATASTCSSSTTFDTLLYVREGDCTGREVGCCDDADHCGAPCAARQNASVVAWPVLRGSVWCVIVDGYNGTNGAFELTITGPPAAPTCAGPPFYPSTFDGPACSVERQELECVCSECFTWDPCRVPAGKPECSEDGYTISRAAPGESPAVVGEVRCSPAYVDEDGVPHVKWCPLSWCAARDQVPPKEGVLYAYTVQGFDVLADGRRLYSVSPSAPVKVRSAPLACFENGREVPCYPGDRVGP